MKKVFFIGLGNMGSSIYSSIKDSYEAYAYDVDKMKVESLKADYLTLNEGLSIADIIIIAVKPQSITKDFLSKIRREGKSYISICAGIPLEVLEKNLKTDNIARFMPNLAAKKKKAVTAMCFSKTSSDEFRCECEKIASSFGSAFSLDESQFSAFIGASGSLIAYALEFISTSAMASVNVGLPYPIAESIVKDTLYSALSLLEDGDISSSVIPKICSAKGTTIAGMEALEENGFQNAIYKAVKAAANKSDEIEKDSKERLL